MTTDSPTDSAHILLVEDATIGGKHLARFLLSFGYRVMLVTGEAAARDALGAQRFDAAIVDLTLSDGDGFGVLDALHAHDPLIPVICTSGQGDLSARVLGLKAGFDHYLGKPFEPLELEALLSTALRRRAQRTTVNAPVVDPPRWEIRAAERCLRLNGALQIPLTDIELGFLSQLHAAAPKTVERASIIEGLGKSERSYSRARLDTMISRLRHKIAQATAEPAPFVSVYGAGYAWVETHQPQGRKNS